MSDIDLDEQYAEDIETEKLQSRLDELQEIPYLNQAQSNEFEEIQSELSNRGGL